MGYLYLFHLSLGVLQLFRVDTTSLLPGRQNDISPGAATTRFSGELIDGTDQKPISGWRRFATDWL